MGWRQWRRHETKRGATKPPRRRCSSKLRVHAGVNAPGHLSAAVAWPFAPRRSVCRRPPRVCAVVVGAAHRRRASRHERRGARGGTDAESVAAVWWPRTPDDIPTPRHRICCARLAVVVCCYAAAVVGAGSSAAHPSPSPVVDVRVDCRGARNSGRCGHAGCRGSACTAVCCPCAGRCVGRVRAWWCFCRVRRRVGGAGVKTVAIRVVWQPV